MSENHRKGPSPESENLAEDIKTIMQSPHYLQRVTNPPSLEEWMNFINEYLEPPHRQISDTQINALLSGLENLQPFDRHFPNNYLCCFTLLPCNTAGNKHSGDELAFNPQIYRIMIPPKSDKNASELYRRQKLLFDLMPEEIKRQCSFRVRDQVKQGKSSNSEAARTGILVRCAAALINLQKILRRER